MKQVVLRGGAPTVVDTPQPSPLRGRVLVANGASVVSAGTERSAVTSSGGGGSLPMRALRNPDLVVQTLDHARKHGVRETVEVVRGAVNDDVVLGYSSAGIVLDTGGIPEFRPGQAVACAGAGNANHAAVVSVPGNLVAPVPAGVELRDAAFTTLGAIAMQGVRRAEPTLGERIAVVGLGLLGLLTVQILRAAGCQVVGVEPVERRRELALQLGAELVLEPEGAVSALRDWTGGIGADATIVTAASGSDAIVNDSIEMVRRKGRVVPVGAVGLSLERPALYQREADVLISTSYGPGRYDPLYEEGGIDYPIAYVRWTENRNMEEFLRLVAAGSVQVAPLVDLELPVDRAPEVYAAIAGDAPPLGAVLTYEPETSNGTQREVVKVAPPRPPRASKTGSDLGVALVGAGSFLRGMHLPNLKADKAAQIKLVVSRKGTTATDVARSLGGAEAATDWRAAVEHDDVDLVIVTTRHDTHAEISAAALAAGKAVFVEKPLGLSWEELDSVWEAGGADARLAIGFNRRYAPLARKLGQEVAAASGPIHLVYRVNAPLATGHWLNDPKAGGGRILGEGCHMFDFANWLCGTPRSVVGAALPAPPELTTIESASVTVSYADGSVATVHYSGAGGPAMPKERVEVLRGGQSWVLDNFTALTRYDDGVHEESSGRQQDKGHATLMGLVLAAARGQGSFEPDLTDAYLAQSVALSGLEAIASGQAVEVRVPAPQRARAAR